MSTEKLSILYQGRTVTISKSSAAIVQSVLEDACAALKLCSSDGLKLVVERGSKSIDHSLTLRAANVKTGNKLEVVRIPANASKVVSVSVNWKETSYVAQVPVSSSLMGVLEAIEKKEGVEWTKWHGIPEPEIHSQFEIHINVPGYMQPVVEVGPRRFTSNDDLQRTTLMKLGLASDNAHPTRVRMKLSHSYQPPQRTEAEQAAVLNNFQRRFDEAMQDVMQRAMMQARASSSSSSSSSSGRRSLTSTVSAVHAQAEEEKKQKGKADRLSSPKPTASDLSGGYESDTEDECEGENEEEKQPPLSIPPDRGLKLLHAVTGVIPPPHLPDEFYEVTEDDSAVYARSIRKEAAQARKDMGGSNTAAKQGALPQIEESPPAANQATAASSASASSAAASSSTVTPPSSTTRRTRRRTVRATLLRIRLPQHLYIEGLFRPDETAKDVYEWMDTLLLPSIATADNYYLYITPPRQQLSRTSPLSLQQLGLLPQAIVHYGSESGRNQQHAVGDSLTIASTAAAQAAAVASAVAENGQPGQGLLRAELLDRIQRFKPTSKTETEGVGDQERNADATMHDTEASASTSSPPANLSQNKAGEREGDVAPESKEPEAASTSAIASHSSKSMSD